MRAVIFDMDGVLVESFEAWFQLMRSTCTHFGHPPCSRAGFLKGWGQSVDEDIRDYFPNATPMAARAYFDEHFDAYRHHVSVMPGAQKLVTQLASHELPWAVVTNTPRRIAALCLADLEAEGIITYCEVHLAEKQAIELRDRIKALIDELAEDDGSDPPDDPRRFRLTLAYFPLDWREKNAGGPDAEPGKDPRQDD